VYLLVNYGDFVDGNTSTTATPYVQLLSMTDPASTHADFLSVRGGAAATPTPAPTPAKHAAVDVDVASTPPPTPTTKGIKGAFLKEKIPIIIALSVGVGLVLLGVFVLMCTRNRISKRGRGSLASTYKSYRRPTGARERGGRFHS
jgi:hypothetical protein